MGWRAVALAAALAAAACSEHKAGEYVGMGQPGAPFDCALGFEKLVSQIPARPGVRHWGNDAEKSRLVQDDDGLGLYIITNPTHPSHPAIIHRVVALGSEGVGFGTAACSYGDRRALDDDLRAYAALDDALAAEFDCYLCNDRLTSPSLERNWNFPDPPKSAR